MINRPAIAALLIMRQRGDGPFADIPVELIREISEYGQDPQSNFANALQHAANGKLNALKAMLDVNPRLVLMAGNATLPGGSIAERTTLLECAIFAGDPKMAEMIKPYYLVSEIVGGEKALVKQLEKCRPHIEALAIQLNQNIPAYDLKPLIEIIKKASTADVTAALNKDMLHASPLRDALIQFRDAVKVKPNAKVVGMHYKHYTTINQALELLGSEWKNLSHNYTNYDKCCLVWRQVFGYLQSKHCGLPKIDQFGFARAFDDEERTCAFKYSPGSFSDVAPGGDLSGVGFDVAIFGGGRGYCVERAVVFKLHVEQKHQTCRTLCSHTSEVKRPGV